MHPQSEKCASKQVVPLKTREPGNHPSLTDVSLRQVGWLGGGQFLQFPTGSQDGEPLELSDQQAVWIELSAAITTACTLRGDTPTDVAGLLREAADLALEHQRDLASHFAEQARIWSEATGQPSKCHERRGSPPVSPMAIGSKTASAPHFATQPERTGGPK